MLNQKGVWRYYELWVGQNAECFYQQGSLLGRTAYTMITEYTWKQGHEGMLAWPHDLCRKSEKVWKDSSLFSHDQIE